MSVEVNVTRKAVNITWDSDKVGSNPVARCTNPDTGDVSVTGNLGADGFGVITFPDDYTGTCDITVKGDDGEDSGSIEV